MLKFLMILTAYLLMATCFKVHPGGLQAQDMAKPDSCYCAVMDKNDSNEPLMEHPFPNNIGCNENATDTCSKLCVALAEATRLSGNAHDVLCHELKKSMVFTVAVFSKVCDDTYKNTGLNYEKPVCCKDGKVCESKHT